MTVRVDIIDTSRRMILNKLLVCKCGPGNSAYRSGCHRFLFSITYTTPDLVGDAGVTQLNSVGRKFGLHLRIALRMRPKKRPTKLHYRRNSQNAAAKHLIPVSVERMMLPSRSLNPCEKSANSPICTPALDTPTAKKNSQSPKRPRVWTAFLLPPRTHKDVRRVCEIIL